MGNRKPTRKRKRLTTRAAFQGHTGKVHVVPLDDETECLMIAPTIAQVKTLDAAEDTLDAVGVLIAALVVDDKGAKVFRDADQANEAFTVDQLEAFGEFVASLGDSKAAAKK